MVENEIKRHDIFLIVFGIILGFADPITDILTLVDSNARITRHGSV